MAYPCCLEISSTALLACDVPRAAAAVHPHWDPTSPPVRQATFVLRIQAHLKHLLHPTGLLLAAASPEDGMLQVTVGYPSTSASASPCVPP